MTRSHKLYYIKTWRRWRVAVQVSLHFRLYERHAELKDRTSCLRRCVLGWSTPLAARIAEAHFLFEVRARMRLLALYRGARAFFDTVRRQRVGRTRRDHHTALALCFARTKLGAMIFGTWLAYATWHRRPTMLCRVSTAQVVSRRQSRVLCSLAARVHRRRQLQSFSVVAGCTFCCVAPSLGPARRAGSNEHGEHSRLRSTVGSCRRWHARWRTGSQVLPRCNGSWSVLRSDGSVFARLWWCGDVTSGTSCEAYAAAGLIQQRRCVGVHWRSGAPGLNWCSPGWNWLRCTGRHVQRRAWRG